MSSSFNLAITTAPPPPGSLSWKSWIGLALLWAASAWLWIEPLWRPRGPYLWGHYRFLDVYAGLPIALVTISATAAALAPARLRRRLALRLAAMCASFIVSLLVVDLAYSLVVAGAWRSDYWLDQAHITRRYSTGDAELGFVRKPHVRWRGYAPDVGRLVEYRTDEQGFRNPPGISRADIVFIGDSFTEAASIDEPKTFVQRVAAETGMTAVNLGRGAYGPQQELIVLERYGLRYQPRVVVWQLFEGNDLGDSSNFAEWRRNPQPPVKPLHLRHFDNSLLRLALSGTWRDSNSDQRAMLRYTDGTSRQVTIRYRYDPRQTEDEPLGFEETQKTIEAGYRLCQSRGIQLVVVHIPVMARVLAPWLDFASAAERRQVLPDDHLSASQDFGSQLKIICQRLGCSYLDLFESLSARAATDNRGLYIPNNEHLDTQGAEVVAQAVARFLADGHPDQTAMKSAPKD